MPQKRPDPTFTVRFVAAGLSPEKVPWRAVSEALSAVQDLASGRDPMERRSVPPEKAIGLTNVRRGSAIYSCISHDPDDARKNLRLVGKALESKDDSENEAGIIRALKPIERLSEVAKNLSCRLEISLVGRASKPLFSIEKDEFARISNRLFLTGETTLIGTVKRVGGQTKMKCALSLPGRAHLLYCDLPPKSKDMVRELGKHLYEEIAVSGTAVWIHRSWHIYKFTISSFAIPKLDDASQLIEKLRAAGLSAWDDVSDPDELIQESRV